LPLVCIFLGVLAWPVRADDGEKAAETFNALFGADLARVRKTGDARDDAALAARLLETAKKATDQVAFLALVCETVANLGLAHPDGYAAAAQAMELLARSVPEKAAACRERLIEICRKRFDAARGDERRAAGEALLDSLLPVIEAREKAGDLAEAAALYRRAKAVATAIESPRAAEVKHRAAALAQKMKMAGKIKDVEALLARDSQNVSAREGLVRIYLVELDDPAESVKHLKGCQDKSLLKYVPAAAKGVEAAPEFACLELGEWYRALAEKAPKDAKAAMYARAKAYLERFLSLHESQDLDRTRGQVALGKVEEALAKPAAAVTPTRPTEPAKTASGIQDGVIKPGRWVDLLPLVDLQQDTVSGAWQRRGDALVIDPRGGDKATIGLPVSISGSYRLSVDFVTGRNLVITLPVGRAVGLLNLGWTDGKTCGLGSIDGKKAISNATTVKRAVGDKRPHTVVVSVKVDGDRAAMAVTLDGTPLTSWSGSQSSLSVPPDKRMSRPDRPGMSTWGTQLSMRRVRLQMLSGEARLLRPAGSAAAGVETATVPTGETIKPGQWVDLLPLVDPAKDAVKGKWTRRDGGLAVTSRTDGQRTVIPVAVTGSYELEVVLVRTEGKDNVAILIPVGTGKVAVSLNAWYKKARLECVYGKPDNATEVEVGALENGRPYAVRISVLAQGNNARVDVSLNGKQVIKWQGPQSALSPSGAWQLPVRRCLGLGTWGPAVAFRRVRLRMLSGEARLLRPVEK